MGCLLIYSGSWCAHEFVGAFQEWSICFSQVCGSPIIKSRWLSRSDSVGIPSLSVGSPGLEACCGVQNLNPSGRTSFVLLFSSLWVTHPAGMGFDFIMIVPILPSHCSVFFVFERGVYIYIFFLVGSSILLLMVVQQLVAILVLLQEEMSTHPSTLPS